MRRLILPCLIVAIACASAATAQTSLAECIPATTLVYLRFDDPIGDWEKLTGSGDIWSQPQRVSSRAKGSLDRGLKKGDKEIGKEEGTIDGWLRSVGSVELALFSMSFGEKIDEGMDGPPSFDFAAIVESPAAIEIYNSMAQIMIDHGQATRNERGDLVLGLDAEFTPLVSVQGSKVIIAGSEDRLNAVVGAFKSGMPENLASDPTFRAVVGDGRGPRIAYARYGALLSLIRDNLSDENQKRMTDIITPLGLTKIAGVGYREDGPNAVITMKGDGPVGAFKLLKGKPAPAVLQGLLPADTAFSIGHTNEFGEHMKRIQKFLIDPTTFPFAPAVAGGLIALSAKVGLTVDEVLTPLKDGIVLAAVPDDNGRLDDERSMVLVARMPVKEEALKLLARAKKAVAKAGKVEIEEFEENGMTWFRPRRGDAQADEAAAAAAIPAGESRPARAASTRPASLRPERPMPLAVFTGEHLIAGWETGVRKTLASVTGKAANLGTTGAFKRLPPEATFYATGSLKALFSNENDFAPALSFLKDAGAVGMSIAADDETLTIHFNRAPGQFIGILATAGAVYEDSRDARREVLNVLEEVGKRTRGYYDQHKKWPASLTDLGYPADKMPAAADSEGKMQPIVFLPPKPDADYNQGWRQLLAYWKPSEYGRLCVDISGTAWAWSESDFLGALSRYNSPAK